MSETDAQKLLTELKTVIETLNDEQYEIAVLHTRLALLILKRIEKLEEKEKERE